MLRALVSLFLLLGYSFAVSCIDECSGSGPASDSHRKSKSCCERSIRYKRSRNRRREWRRHRRPDCRRPGISTRFRSSQARIKASSGRSETQTVSLDISSDFRWSGSVTGMVTALTISPSVLPARRAWCHCHVCCPRVRRTRSGGRVFVISGATGAVDKEVRTTGGDSAIWICNDSAGRHQR